MVSNQFTHRPLPNPPTKAQPTTGSLLHLWGAMSNGPKLRRHSSGRTIRLPTQPRDCHRTPTAPTEWIATIKPLRLFLTGNQVRRTRSGALLLGVRGGVNQLDRVARTVRSPLKALVKEQARVAVKARVKDLIKVEAKDLARVVDKVPVKALVKVGVRDRAKAVPAPPQRLLRAPHLPQLPLALLRAKFPSTPLRNPLLHIQRHLQPVRGLLVLPARPEHRMFLDREAGAPMAG